MKNKTKTLWIVLSIALLLTVSVGSTLAYLITSSEDVENTFTPSYVTCQIVETRFDPNGSKEGVYVTNTGNIDAYIRAAVVVTWKDAENGNVYGGGKPEAGTDYTIEMDKGWTYNTTDGFWYCNTAIEPGKDTPVLIKSCYPNADETPAGYGLNVEILAQAIQATGMTGTQSYTAAEAWSLAKGGN